MGNMVDDLLLAVIETHFGGYLWLAIKAKLPDLKTTGVVTVKGFIVYRFAVKL